jgi:nitrogen regulatory protein PII
MKMVMISYNEAIDDEVMEVLGSCALKNYTKIKGVFGRGETSGTHLGDDIWPGRNNILFVACEDKEAKNLLFCIKNLRKTLGKEGIKAFVLPLEEVTSTT